MPVTVYISIVIDLAHLTVGNLRGDKSLLLL